MATPRADRIFLSREGELLGPLTTAQLDGLRKSGDLSRYTWLWTDSAQSWVPANSPPPPPPSADEEVDDAPPPVIAGAAKGRPTLPSAKPAAPLVRRELPAAVVKAIEGIAAICFDSETVVSGTVSQISSKGCVLSSPHFGSGFSPLSTGAKLTVNLLHEASGRSQSVKTTLADKRRQGSSWVYLLQWEGIPELLEDRS